jgi:membrane-associated phospholipid phosphatase
LTDWVEDIVFLTFFTIAIWQAPRGERTRRAAQLLFTILFAACVIFFINRVLFRETLHIPRDSPSIVVQPCIRLSDEVRWMSVKDDSHSSFPGDHATTLILFAACTTFFAGRRLGLYAILYAALRTLPRLVAGAHWFSDVAVGGGTIVLTTLAWGLCTPLHLWGTRMFERILSGRSWKIALRKTP